MEASEWDRRFAATGYVWRTEPIGDRDAIDHPVRVHRTTEETP